MTFWILALSYWIHLLATVIWLGGMALMGLVAWPALQRGTLEANQWFVIQRRFLPWANVSLVILLITGFVQMTNDVNYSGFLAVDSVWAWAMLLKHIAYVGMVLITVYMQAVLYPAMKRTALLAKHLSAAQRPSLAQDEQNKLQTLEIRFLRLNLVCAMGVLLFTAVATAF